MGAMRNIFNGLLGLVGLAPEPDNRPYERRVFLVTDPGKREEILNMMAKREASVMALVGLFREVVDNPEKRSEAQTQFSAIAHEKPSDSEKLNTLVGIASWPGMLAAKKSRQLLDWRARRRSGAAQGRDLCHFADRSAHRGSVR